MHTPYELLTPEEKKEICNGCGGKGSSVVPPHAVFFEASCNHHDYGYWKGGAEEDRKKCDDTFYRMMKKDCDRLPWYSKPRYKVWCWIYYKAVRTFGKKYFNYKDVSHEGPI